MMLVRSSKHRPHRRPQSPSILIPCLLPRLLMCLLMCLLLRLLLCLL
jgi:hypothetical protein